MFSLFDLAAILLTLTALLGWLSFRFLPLPSSIGLLVMSVATSLILIVADIAFPSQHLYDALRSALSQIDFTGVVMNGMLAFLIFAGALNVDLSALRRRALPVFILAVLGTIISTAVVGTGLWAAAEAIGHPLSFSWALVLGALISPTDPVSVMATLKTVDLPEDLEVEMQGEALFNDGVGIVLFTILLSFAGGGNTDTSVSGIAKLVVVEAGGGLLLGTVTGYLAFWAMKAIDDYPTEVLISLALVTGTYAIAERLHCSGPLAMVAAGLLIGDKGPKFAMSDKTKTYLFGLWTVIDEILNAVLFLLIGLQVIVLRVETFSLALALLAIPIVLLARLLAVAAPLPAFIGSSLLSTRNVPFLTWAGVRGGISVALALSVPDSPDKPTILAVTYAVVLFSIIIQGSSLGYVARKTLQLDEA